MDDGSLPIFNRQSRVHLGIKANMAFSLHLPAEYPGCHGLTVFLPPWLPYSILTSMPFNARSFTLSTCGFLPVLAICSACPALPWRADGRRSFPAIMLSAMRLDLESYNALYPLLSV